MTTATDNNETALEVLLDFSWLQVMSLPIPMAFFPPCPTPAAISPAPPAKYE